jgi:hypothetical protein
MGVAIAPTRPVICGKELTGEGEGMIQNDLVGVGGGCDLICLHAYMPHQGRLQGVGP